MQKTSPLSQAVGDLDEATAVALVKDALAGGASPLGILEELQAGMGVVGERFERGDYFLRRRHLQKGRRPLAGGS
jgi:dimethylamine corrinoid protein